jgi:hypothetical protein
MDGTLIKGQARLNFRVKSDLEQATKAQRGSTGIAVLFL